MAANHSPRVLHVCYWDSTQGAAIGAYGLHRAMSGLGIDSRMLVMRKRTDDDTVIEVPPGVRRRANWARRFSSAMLMLQSCPSRVFRSLNMFPTGMHTVINGMNCDVVQLHWISRNMISVSEIAQIAPPVVWKMPDMWAFSGAEHYTLPGEPQRFRDGYSKTNRAVGSRGIDIDRLSWLHKRRVWGNSSFTVVGTSTWIAECARQSILFKEKDVRKVSNPIDTSVFYPEDTMNARRNLNLPLDRQLLLVGAWNMESDTRKGYRYLLDTVGLLRSQLGPERFELIVFGDRNIQTVADRRVDDYQGIKVHHIGEVSHGGPMREVYSAADVYITPALLEGFGLTAAESLACGTPVVCFDTSGLKDIVDHLQNGYRAACYSVEDLANGITWVLAQQKHKLSSTGVRKVRTAFSWDNAVSGYLSIYADLLADRYQGTG